MDSIKVLDQLLSISDNQIKSLELVFEQFLSKVDEPENKFLQKLSSCSGNSEMMDLVKEHFEWIPLSPAIRNKYAKNNEISTTFRNIGNAAFQKKRYTDALRSYNLAAIFAVQGGTELGLSYANRSAALHSMGLTDEALKDIDLAVSNGYPNESGMLKKLEDRKRRFEAQLAERLKNSPMETQLKDDVSKRDSFYEDLFTLKSSNPLAPALDDSIAIQCNSLRGRHIVANKDIPIGATLLVEKPFVAVLKKTLNWEVDHCHYCLKKNFRCIPCPNCVFTQYCNEKCRAEAHEYHQYECPCLPELHCILNDDMGKGNLHLAFKLICIMGPNKLFTMFKERKNKNNVVEYSLHGNFIPGCDPDTGIYDCSSYRTIYNLMTSKTPKEGYYLFLLSLTLSRTLKFNSTFFDSITNATEQLQFQDFIAELIIHHFETFRRNVYELEEIIGLEGITLRTYMEMKPKGRLDIDIKPFAAGAFATASLINHSCNQNVVRFFGKTFGTTAIIALKPLKKGEELLISYGPLYGSLRAQDESASSRQAVLNEKYDFLCNCVACRYDLPGYRDLKMNNLTTGFRRKPGFCCPMCVSKFPHENRLSPEFLQCKLTENFKCKLCSYQHSQQWIEKEYVRHCAALESCMKSVLSDIVNSSSIETISSLKSALQFFETYVCPPNYQSLDGSLLYRDNVKFMIYFSDRKV